MDEIVALRFLQRMYSINLEVLDSLVAPLEQAHQEMNAGKKEIDLLIETLEQQAELIKDEWLERQHELKEEWKESESEDRRKFPR